MSFLCKYKGYEKIVNQLDIDNAEEVFIEYLAENGIEPDLETEIIIESMKEKKVVPTVNFTPLNDYVLFDIDKVKEETSAGIIKSPEMIAEEKNNRDGFHLVISVGENVSNIKSGDSICISSGAIMIDIDGVDYGLIRSHSVIGKRSQ